MGNDSGLWRSIDAVGESGQAARERRRSHFQNLNGGLGSLAEVVSLSAIHDALHDDGRTGRERHGGREERSRFRGLAADSGRLTAGRWRSIRSTDKGIKKFEEGKCERWLTVEELQKFHEAPHKYKDESEAPAGVTLSGTGFDFAAAVSGTGSLTVASGQTAYFTLTINPGG